MAATPDGYGFVTPPPVEINGVKLSPDDIKVIKQSKAKLKLKVGKANGGKARTAIEIPACDGVTRTVHIEGDGKPLPPDDLVEAVNIGAMLQNALDVLTAESRGSDPDSPPPSAEIRIARAVRLLTEAHGRHSRLFPTP